MTRRLLLALALAGAAAAAAGAAAAPAAQPLAQTKHVCVIGSSDPSGGGYDGYCVTIRLPLSGT